MSNIANLGTFPHTIGNLDDRPNLTAAQMKAALEQDVMTLWGRLAEAIPMINDILPASRLVDIVNSSSTASGVPTAKAVYDAIADASLGGNAQQIIDDWLTAHPEATTTVQDGSITNAKLATSFTSPGVAAAYSSSNTYAVGDYVFYNNNLYRCITDITTAEAWNAAHWTQILLGDDVSSLNRDLSQDTRNLFYDKNISNFYYMSEVDGVFTNTIADTRGYVIGRCSLYNGATQVQTVSFGSIILARNYVTFTASGSADSILLKDNGETYDLGIKFSCSIQSGETYTLSFRCLGADPSTVGGFVFNDVQLELGSVMTHYIPHITAKDTELREAFRTVEEFGAIGDGVTDCTSSIQNAIASETNVLYFTGGTYIVSDKINLKSNIKLIGQGKTTIKWTGCSTTAATSYVTGQNMADITIENIVFDFGPLVNLRYGLSILDSSNISVRKCAFKNCYGYANRFNGCSNLRIQDCDYSDITGASGNPGGGIYASGFHDVFVTGCSCSNLGDHFLYCAGDVEVYNVIVSDCDMKTTGANNLTNGAAITLYANCHDVNISNCSFKQVKQGLYIGKYGALTTLPHDINITNCSLSNVQGNGIEIIGISSSNYIYNANIDNCVINTGSGDMILLRHAVRLSLSNLKIMNPYRTGIEVSDVHQSCFANISLSGVRDTGVYVSNQNHLPDSTDNVFSGIFVAPASGGMAETSNGFLHRSGARNLITNVVAFGFTHNITRDGSYLGCFNMGTLGDSRAVLFTSDITESIYHTAGDIVFNSTPTSGNPVMWVCTVSGKPGTMTPVLVMP